MANELKHISVGTELTQSEFESVTLHQCDGQAVGDMLHATSTTQLSRYAPVIRKTADETVNNSAILQDDDHLSFSIGASEEWVFEIVLAFTSNATADLQIAVTVPSGASVFYGAHIGTPPNFTATSGTGLGVSSAGGALEGVLITGWVLNSTTAGTVQLQWAQNTADLSDTVVKKGSYLTHFRVA
jgi:hypothetical protein